MMGGSPRPKSMRHWRQFSQRNISHTDGSARNSIKTLNPDDQAPLISHSVLDDEMKTNQKRLFSRMSGQFNKEKKNSVLIDINPSEFKNILDEKKEEESPSPEQPEEQKETKGMKLLALTLNVRKAARKFKKKREYGLQLRAAVLWLGHLLHQKCKENQEAELAKEL